ncbi:MAG: SpoIIE family protein phosphatase [Planctomycetota bacterium]|nr:MAG: SpoIIE family protein phosphatase [Planctomycetota bacterium]
MAEQRDREGEEFGHARTIDALRPSQSAADDVSRLFEAVESHAGADALDDDVTVASLSIESA